MKVYITQHYRVTTVLDVDLASCKDDDSIRCALALASEKATWLATQALRAVPEVKEAYGTGEPECVCGEQPAEPAAPAPELPLMARREWMDGQRWVSWDGAGLCYAHSEPPRWNDTTRSWVSVTMWRRRAGDFLWSSDPRQSLHRIASRDEHGLPVIPREPGMPEWAKYRFEQTMNGHSRLTYESGYHVGCEERIEDYRPAAQESGDA